MSDFFTSMGPEDAIQLEKLTRLIYELRENRETILRGYGIDDEAALLAQIEAGTIAEHPAYEHYLSARILSETRGTVRTMLTACLKEVGRA